VKKGGTILLIVITVMFAAFTVGIFVGRNSDSASVSIHIPSTDSSQDGLVQQQPVNNSANTKININTATLEQLKTLPGIGEVLAQRILDYRNSNGSYSSIYDLAKIEGIGTQKLLSILDFISVED